MLAGQPDWAVIVSKLNKPRSQHIATPGFEIIKRTVASPVPAFLVVAVRVRAEHHPTPFQSCAQFQQYAWQFLAGYMKQRGVGEHAIEMVVRQIEVEEILLGL